MADDTGLLAASDADFAWMMGEPDAVAPAHLRLPEGGIEEPPILAMLRQVGNEVRQITGGGAWMITAQGEAVGLISFLKPPDHSGSVEFGYGIAASRRARGHATRAVLLLVDMLRQENKLRVLTAGTAMHNVASQRVLERAGFEKLGTRFDEDDGDILSWRLRLR